MTFQNGLQDSLQSNRADLNKLFDATPFPLLLSQPLDGKIVNLNQAALDLLEIPSDHHDDLFTLSFYADVAEREHILVQLQTDGNVRDRMLELRTWNGKQKFGLLNAAPLTIQNQNYYLVGIVDMTEYRRFEEHISQINDELEAEIQIS